jgi:S1-C subfamily serine protease
MRSRLIASLVSVVLVWGCGISWSQPPAAGRGQPSRAYLGIAVEPSQGENVRGLVVREVAPESPAAKAGLKDRDVIVGVGDKDAKDFDALVNALSQHKPGDKVTLKVKRGDEEKNLTVTLSARPGRRGAEKGRERTGAFLGVQTQELTPEMKQKYNVSIDKGAMVSQVVPDSAAAEAKLQPGDVITAVNGKNVSSPEDLRRLIHQAQPGQEAKLQIHRGQETKELKAQLKESPVDGINFFPVPFPGGAEGRGIVPGFLGSSEKVQELERKVQDLEKRVRELEAHQKASK